MLSKTFLTLIVAGCLSVAVAATWRAPNAVPKDDIGYGSTRLSLPERQASGGLPGWSPTFAG